VNHQVASDKRETKKFGDGGINRTKAGESSNRARVERSEAIREKRLPFETKRQIKVQLEGVYLTLASNFFHLMQKNTYSCCNQAQ
jgi:hypothetical protein